MTMRRPVGPMLLALLVALVLDSWPGRAQTAPAPADAAPAPAAVSPPAAGPTPLKLGVLVDRTGPYAAVGGEGSLAAARMAVADHGGTAGGRPIVLVEADDQNDLASADATLTHWFDQDGVEAVVGLGSSALALAAQELARPRDKTLLIVGAADSDLSGKACSATSTEWAEDTYALAHGTTDAVVQSGGDSWFFLTVDYAFGQAMERDAVEVVRDRGALMLGQVRHPLGIGDFSSYLAQAKASAARVVALADAGSDVVAAIRQARQPGVLSPTQALAAYLVYITDIDAIGLAAAERLYVTEGFYWDQNDAARAFAKRFNAELHRMPTKQQAGIYAATTHYLKAVDAAGTTEAKAVNAKMRALPVDFFGRAGSIRPDGRVLYDLTLYQVKSPQQSHYAWDYYQKVRDIPAAAAFRPMSEGHCPLVQ